MSAREAGCGSSFRKDPDVLAVEGERQGAHKTRGRDSRGPRQRTNLVHYREEKMLGRLHFSPCLPKPGAKLQRG